MELRWLLPLLLVSVRCPCTHQQLGSSSEDQKKSPGSVQECRVLVDKALEQYWDKKVDINSDQSLDNPANLNEEKDESIIRDGFRGETEGEKNTSHDDNDSEDTKSDVENDGRTEDDCEDDDEDEEENDDDDEEDEDDDEDDDVEEDNGNVNHESEDNGDEEDDESENNATLQEIKNIEEQQNKEKQGDIKKILEDNDNSNSTERTEDIIPSKDKIEDTPQLKYHEKDKDSVSVEVKQISGDNKVDNKDGDIKNVENYTVSTDTLKNSNENISQSLGNKALPSHSKEKEEAVIETRVVAEMNDLKNEPETSELNLDDDESDESETSLTRRSRDHITDILGELADFIDEESKSSVLKEIKKLGTTSIRPMELLYKYADSTTRLLGDAEIFNKPMLLFLGPWNSGKTSAINYILGIEDSDTALKTGTGITDTDFTIVSYGERHRVVTGTELAADWRYSGLQKFGQGFSDHFRSILFPNPLLEKVILVDTPGILENRKNQERSYSLRDVFQWFMDRADAVYVVLDPTKVDIGHELGSILELSRDARFLLNKADSVERTDLLRVVGQLFWNLSPLVASSHAPTIYAVSLRSKSFLPNAPQRFLLDQEKNFLSDMKRTVEEQVQNRILYARKHAVRVRNHAKMVDCFLASYYRHKSIFSSKRNIAKLIIENPREYNIWDGMSSLTNISRYDMPNPLEYKEFFKTHPLYDFKPLSSTCSYFRGCPMDKLDTAIAKEIPELLARYKKLRTT